MHQDNNEFHPLLLMETKDMFFLTGFHFFEIISVRLAELILQEGASIFLLTACTQLGQGRRGMRLQ